MRFTPADVNAPDYRALAGPDEGCTPVSHARDLERFGECGGCGESNPFWVPAQEVPAWLEEEH